MENNIKNRFTKNASWLIIGRIIQLGLTFITTTLIARYLGPAEYGTITHTYAYVALFVQICALGTNEIIVKELLDNKDRNDEIVGSILLTRFICSGLSILILYLFVRNISKDITFISVTFLQSISLLFQSFECITYFYQSKLEANKTSLINIISYTLTSLFRIYGLITKKDINWFAFAVSLDFIVLGVLLLTTYLKNGYKLKFSFDLTKQLFNKSKHYLFANIMVVIYSQIDKIILGNMICEEAVGWYGAATQLCNAWPFVLIAIIDSASPIIIELFNKDKELFKQKLKQLYASIFYIGVFVALIFTLFSDLIINIVFGAEYINASVPLKIASWSTIFAYFGVSRTIWLQCNNKLKYEKNIALTGAIVGIILSFIFISLFGIDGAALSLTLTQIITNFVCVYMIKETRENAVLLFDAIRLKGVFNK